MGELISARGERVRESGRDTGETPEETFSEELAVRNAREVLLRDSGRATGTERRDPTLSLSVVAVHQPNHELAVYLFVVVQVVREPAVLHRLPDLEPLVRVLVQQLAYQVDERRREERREPNAALGGGGG